MILESCKLHARQGKLKVETRLETSDEVVGIRLAFSITRVQVNESKQRKQRVQREKKELRLNLLEGRKAGPLEGWGSGYRYPC